MLMRAIQDYLLRRSAYESVKNIGKCPNVQGAFREIRNYFFKAEKLQKEPFQLYWILQHISSDPDSTRLKILNFLEDSHLKSMFQANKDRRIIEHIIRDFMSLCETTCRNQVSTYNE